MSAQSYVAHQAPPPYQAGDTIVHPVHGIGVVTRLEEMKQGEQSRLYYVIAMDGKVTVWVPVDAAAQSGMRPVVSASGFKMVSRILSSAAQPLTDQAHERQLEMHERLNQGSLEALCTIVRDLTARSSGKRLNENDARILKRARKLLLDEWVLATDMLYQEAQSQLGALLLESQALSKPHLAGETPAATVGASET
jgi:RNA polymerase-interacting CarD/CdnL/TRCF family regulator